jgi:hypothetical protein
MNDARLKSLYRQLTADAPRDGIAVADMLEPLSRSGYPDVEGTPLDRIAASAAHADVLRAAMMLDADSTALAHELAALRAPRRAPAARRWLALAAGVGAAAILVVGLRPGTPPVEVSDADMDSATILSVSFDSPPPPENQAQPRDAAPIFSGGFDS